MSHVSLKDVQVLAPNFKRRLSGVTSTIVQLIPVQNRLGQKVAVIGPGLPPHLPHVRFRDLWRLWQNGPFGGPRIWHARRNLEMLPGIFMRDVLRMKVKLLFTSAAQRRHSAYTRFLISKMDAVVATSGRSGSFLEVPHSVVMHGVDTDLFHPAEGPEDTIASTGLPGHYLIGCFGRVRHQKGTDLFVRAMIELLPAHPEWTAVVSGRVTAEHKAFGDALKADVAAAGLSDRIVFQGEVDDIKPWYRRLTLYVAPSRNEGFGLTPLEAMASETSVVASNAGAYEEMIVKGKTGMVVEAGDYAALVDAIKPYLADPALAKNHALAGLAHVRTTFPLEKEATSLGAVYDTLRRA
ncbi:glycosyltransferase family 4 protein [Agrobacterium sp. O3.4]|uniref:Glycosyltransferase family 4 protein n=1 Tax=Agrobacterium cucumeris TaxID=2862866 RepID=A0ABY8RJG6_9HYPH|nr:MULTISPECIES: glycosyltransferase family 4 protein [Rhizobium/Agrobacterium group]MCZ7471479.1 glycosyltransferase family 4 protein [Rhizobium rhizogenes]MCZ7486484.1 glycosyltransferase family 4 protein [Rhizobium rhizogenes]WHO07312.1 glycosyltransferase family 4 protein [Agrobacterium cucumeris]